MNNDLISRSVLKKAIINNFDNLQAYFPKDFIEEIDNAPTVDMNTELSVAYLKGRRQGQSDVRPQGEYVDISKLRLMTVEECAGHTIDYAMGWKACIDWIKKGGKEE